MQESKAKEKPEACKRCKNPGCRKCGTTHGIWECIAPKEKPETLNG